MKIDSKKILKITKSILWILSNFLVMALWFVVIPVSFAVTTWITDVPEWHVAILTASIYGGLYACCWYNVWSLSKAIGKDLKEL